MSLIADALAALPDALLDQSGRVFYSGKSAFGRRTDVYVLGLNPGGSVERQAKETVQLDLAQWRQRLEPWSAYVEEEWEGRSASNSPLQRRLRHMFDRIGRSLEATPSSNAIFLRSNDEAALAEGKDGLLAACWPVHRAVIDQLGISTVLCFGNTVATWVCRNVGATTAISNGFREANRRGWTGSAKLSPTGIAVVQVPHPARADWCNPLSDPSDFVRTIIER